MTIKFNFYERNNLLITEHTIVHSSTSTCSFTVHWMPSGNVLWSLNHVHPFAWQFPDSPLGWLPRVSPVTWFDVLNLRRPVPNSDPTNHRCDRRPRPDVLSDFVTNLYRHPLLIDRVCLQCPNVCQLQTEKMNVRSCVGCWRNISNSNEIILLTIRCMESITTSARVSIGAIYLEIITIRYSEWADWMQRFVFFFVRIQRVSKWFLRDYDVRSP